MAHELRQGAGGGTGAQIENALRANDVRRHPDRTRHRLGQIGDGTSPPTTDLVSEVPESAKPAHPDRPPGHDPAFFPSQVQDRRALDDESSSGSQICSAKW